MVEILTAIRCVYLLAVALSTTLNALALVLICRRSGPRMRKYRPFLGFICAVGLVYGVLLALVQPRIVPIDTVATLLISHGPVEMLLGVTHLSASIVHLLFCSCALIFNVYILAFALSFVYRFVVLAKPHFIANRLTIHRIAGLFTGIFAYAGVVFVIALYARASDKTMERYRRLDIGGIQIGLGADEESRLPQLVMGSVSTLNLVICYSIITFCSIRVYRLLGKHRKRTASFRRVMSRNTRRNHLHLFKSLLVQSFLPLLHIVPVYILTTIARWQENAFLSYMGYVLIAWMPVLDPICTIWFVEPYRRAVFPCQQRPAAGGGATTTLAMLPRSAGSNNGTASGDTLPSLEIL